MEESLDAQRAPRETLEASELDGQFLLREHCFTHQYYHIYVNRIAHFLPIMRKIAEAKWPNHRISPNVLGIESIEGTCIAIGTIYKESHNRFNLIKEYAKQRMQSSLRPRRLMKCVHPEDYCVIEDESSRARLRGNFPSERVVTGTCVAVLGHELENGDFEVEDYVFPGLPPQKPLPTNASPGRIAFISGLRFGASKCPLATELALDYLTGYIGSPAVQSEAAKIAHVVVAGNSLVATQPLERKIRTYHAHGPEKVVGPSQDLDLFLARLASSVDVTLMPGAQDATNYMLPQQPYHRLLLPRTSPYRTYHPATNPHRFSVADRMIVGTGGQPIDDVHHYSDLEPLDALVATLEWQHLAPTAPDLMGCYPFVQQEPFVLHDCPHIYFAGNQKEFASRIVEGPDGQRTLCLLVPTFSTTQTLVIVDLATLECTPVRLAVPGEGPDTTEAEAVEEEEEVPLVEEASIEPDLEPDFYDDEG